MSRVLPALALLASLSCASDPWPDGAGRRVRPEGPAPAPEVTAPVPLETRWAAEVDPDAPLAEHPRPSLVRPRWLSLNGRWQFSVADTEEPPPLDRPLGRRIVVPFPVESRLSGVGEHAEVMWYRRAFQVPEAWRGERVLLHFGAVDWEARVWINGQELPTHRGGYDAFSHDLTPYLRRSGRQDLVVRVFDPTDGGGQPRGKQKLEPQGIYYTPVSGIWQTVWIEAVPERAIDALDVRGDLDAGAVRVTATGVAPSDDRVVASVIVNGQEVASASGAVGDEVVVPIRAPRAWSPDDPFLYDLVVERRAADGAVLDSVSSYFGLRTIEVAPDEDGVPRLVLNGEPLFQTGVLDQGYWPEGLYTAPTDEALRFDVEATKRLGFNLSRKHAKIEPERWYTWCDRVGLLVWQDMPSGLNGTPAAKEQFELELARMIETRRHHPSIVMWVLFNEGWGQFDTERLVEDVRRLDPTRLVSNASGWTDSGAGDVVDVHAYPGPTAPVVTGGRAAVLGEYGGLGLAIDEHRFPGPAWGYRSVADAGELEFAIENLARRLAPLVEAGLAAAVYTQLVDVETECNGLLTYDREVYKVAPARLARVNAGDVVPLHPLVPTSEEESALWAYRFEEPPSDWALGGPRVVEAGAGPGEWRIGAGGFGREGTPGANVGSPWTGHEIWMRRTFLLGEVPENEVHVRIHHDEDAEVYLNGERILTATGYTTGYELRRADRDLRELLVAGENVIAVHCRQTRGGQYIDVGLDVEGE